MTVSATGGDITYLDGYKIHTFRSSGTFTVTTGGNVEALVVAGGGAGWVGGGGAGGLIYTAALAVGVRNIAVTVGAGGVSANGSNSVITDGGISFATQTAIGGGRGSNVYNTVGSNGGSGGGGWTTPTTPTAGQGNAGGIGVPNTGAGGGGGAGAVGGNGALGQVGGVGGAGLQYSVSGSATYYAGGGAGQGNGTPAGGVGGGGGLGENGTDGTGGGGGGRVAGAGTGETDGGDGVVIFRYALDAQTARRVAQNEDLASMAESTIKGRAASAGTGIPQDLTAAQVGAIIESGHDFDYIDFDTTPTAAAAVGRLRWSEQDGVLEFGAVGGNVNVQLGQETVIRIVNKTGVQLNDGQAVYVNGAQGNRPTAALAKADAESTSHGMLGIITENIANNAEGFVTVLGIVRGYNTSGFTDGDELYLSATTAGGLTNVPPTAPNHATLMAIALNSTVNGMIFVRPQSGFELDELHDVLITAIANNDILKYESATGLWKNSNTLASDQVTMPVVGSPTINTLTEDFTTRGSSGVIDGTLTYVEQDTGTYKVKVNAGEGYLRTSDDQQAPLKIITWSAVTQIDIPAPATGYETVRFIGIEYNAGTPQVTTRTSFNWNWHSDFPLARVSIDALGVMHILNAYAHTEDIANLAIKWMRLNFPFHREEPPEGSGGIVVAEGGTRNLEVSTGYMWHGFNRYYVQAIDTAGTDTFDLLYRRAGGGYTGVAGNTQWPNTQYDDGTGTLATLGVNKYACLWVYLDLAEEAGGVPGIDVIYGRGEYTSVVLAQAESAPTPLPDHLTYHGRLLARLIFKKSDSTLSLNESAWANEVGYSPVSDHNQLSNVQGGISPTEHYHLTNAQHTLVTKLGDGITTGKVLTLTATDNFNLTVPATGQALVSAVGATVVGQIPFYSSTGGVLTSESNFFWDATNNRLGIGIATPTSALHIISSDNIHLLISQSVTDATIKTTRIASGHYTNAEEPATLLIVASSSATNTLSFGGGSGVMNAATVINFYTAINNTTTTGTIRMAIEANGTLVGNDGGEANADFRWESDTEANMLWLDANGNTDGTLYIGGNSITTSASFRKGGVFYPVQAATASAPTYVKGGVYFDTTLNKLRVGGATAWETITSA